MVDTDQTGNRGVKGPADKLRRFQRKHHLSNRTMVSLFIFFLMLILIAVYAVQLRNSMRAGAQSSQTAMTNSEYGTSAAEAEPSADEAEGSSSEGAGTQ